MKRLIALFALSLAACAPETLPLRMPTETATDPHHVVGSFDASDGTHLFWQAWRPDGPPRALVVIHHGLKSHSQHYEGIARRLNAQGVAVYAFDMRGHGRSEGPRATLDDFDQLTADLDRFVALARGREPHVPTFLMGHSVGGCVVTLYTLTYHPELAGLVVLAPAIRIDAPILLPAAAPLAATLTPNFPAVDVPDDAFRRDPAAQAEMANDPLIYHPSGPARTAGALTAAIEKVWARADTLDVPLLGMHGDDDRATDVRGTVELVKRARTADKKLLVYHGVRHDLLHEPEKDQISDDLVTWIGARITPRSGLPSP